MTRTRPAATPPELRDPGHGRTWQWDLVQTNPLRPSKRAWFGSLVSRSGSVLGYIGEYEGYGWSGSVKTRSQVKGRQFRPLRGTWTSPEAAAEELLRSLREKR